MGLIGNPKFDKVIAQMNVGERGFAHPAALVFDISGKIYLNLNATVYPEPYEAYPMPVTKTGPNEADYDIDTNFEFYENEPRWRKINAASVYSGLQGLVLIKDAPQPTDLFSVIREPTEKEKLQDEMRTAASRDDFDRAIEIRDILKYLK